MGKIITTLLILAAILTNGYGDEGKILKDFFRVSQNAPEVFITCQPYYVNIDFSFGYRNEAEKQKEKKYRLNPNPSNQEILFMGFDSTNKVKVKSRNSTIGKLTILDQYSARFDWLEKNDYILFKQIKLLPIITENPKNKTFFKQKESDASGTKYITTPENIIVTDPINHAEYRCTLTAEFDLE